MRGVALAAFFAFMYAYRRSPRMQYTADRVLLKVPVLGNVLHNSSIARFARTLAVTFKAGVPLVEAMESVAGATGNRVYTNTVLEMRDDVSVGYPLNRSEEHTSELQSLMRISYAVFCLKTKKIKESNNTT